MSGTRVLLDQRHSSTMLVLSDMSQHVKQMLARSGAQVEQKESSKQRSIKGDFLAYHSSRLLEQCKLPKSREVLARLFG